MQHISCFLRSYSHQLYPKIASAEAYVIIPNVSHSQDYGNVLLILFPPFNLIINQYFSFVNLFE